MFVQVVKTVKESSFVCGPTLYGNCFSCVLTIIPLFSVNCSDLCVAFCQNFTQVIFKFLSIDSVRHSILENRIRREKAQFLLAGVNGYKE